MIPLEDEKRRLLEAQIDIVIEHLEYNAVSVEFGGKINGFYYEENLIAISNGQSLVSKFYTLLHEAGHWTLRKSGGRFSDSTRPPGRMNKRKRVETLHEEFLAWDAGFDLAMELGLYIDEDRWRNISHKHLYDYISWAHKPVDYRKKHERR